MTGAGSSRPRQVPHERPVPVLRYRRRCVVGGIGSGAKPKTYQPELVVKVGRLYAEGRTQTEIAQATGLTQRVIWKVMRRHGISARVAAKRHQTGAANHAWKGDDAGYQACHLRVQVRRGKPTPPPRWGSTAPRPAPQLGQPTAHYPAPPGAERGWPPRPRPPRNTH